MKKSELAEEIFRIKARQRLYEMHDEWCNQYNDLEHWKWQELNQSQAPRIKVRPCNCWLVKEK